VTGGVRWPEHLVEERAAINSPSAIPELPKLYQFRQGGWNEVVRSMIEVGKALLSTEWELTSLSTLRSTSGLRDRVQLVRSICH
jgi:hypothetical protein